ncbi:hypothetical protein CEXT_634811 [Caerostris extrusa]|uniref:Uncharacterized protein n=1 Tax=Caerostris extrusa TaxID=172846 RepID=A0AAV4RDN2_CAEEX|nr:hypothetical protein CEXT_634811 [Caerostris extrusa]
MFTSSAFVRPKPISNAPSDEEKTKTFSGKLHKQISKTSASSDLSSNTAGGEEYGKHSIFRNASNQKIAKNPFQKDFSVKGKTEVEQKCILKSTKHSDSLGHRKFALLYSLKEGK